jgi:DNA polymerase III epsilon subunit family exonuclease
MNIERDLNEQQRKAVYHYKGPALVLAGPGSGKTRVITYRVAYLIRHHNIPPESILAVTFTNKASKEMENRLRDDALLGETIGFEVWIHTFHSACVRILREHGDKIGLNTNFSIIDQDIQEEKLAEIIRNYAPSISESQVWLARDFISSAKIDLKNPTEPHDIGRLNQYLESEESLVTLDDLYGVARHYQDYLARHEALDFDDLVSKTVDLLANVKDVRNELQSKFRFIMVDEYQDINYAQYELIRKLCNSEKNLMAVADDDQSIYSWRGSNPGFIDNFKEEYNPRIIQLIDHFRSTKNLLRASQSLINKNIRRKKGSLITDNDTGSVIYHYKLDTIMEEMRLVAWLIRNIIREKHYSPGQIAIFYRTHRLADKLQQYLSEHNIDVYRIRPDSFFEEGLVRGVMDYLRLLCWHPEIYIKRVINFPTPVLDELTKLQLERIARKSGVEFGQLLRNIALSDNPIAPVGPLTKHRIKNFVSSVDSFKVDPREESVSKTVKRLFDFLESLRSPYHSGDLADIESPQGSGNFWSVINKFHDFISQEKPISIVAAYGIDNYSAAGIIMHVLQNYLKMGDRVTCQFLPRADAQEDFQTSAALPIAKNSVIDPDDQEDALYIAIGSPDDIPEEIVNRAILIGVDDHEKPANCVANLPAGEGGVVSTTALKLCQRLMSSFEAGNTDGLVVYDLETISNNPRTADIIEIGAKRLGSRQEEDRFHKLIKPRRPIPKSSTDIHGITNEDVKDAPRIEEVLPSFVNFIGDSILVGHNIIEFDNEVINRYMSVYMERPELPNSSYDTLDVAKNLFPLENHKLDVMADKFGISHDRLHRAEADIDLTEKLFRYLRRKDLMKIERRSLPEALPLIAMGILEKNAAMEKENIAFYNAAVRYLRHRSTSQKAIELFPIAHLEAAEEEEAIDFLDMVKGTELPDTKDDMDWNATKARLQNIVLDFELSSYDKSLGAFLNYASLFTNADNTDEEEYKDKVTMMTAHSAKGTEFPVVIMIGMEQGNFPLTRPDQTEEELEEERRLCYVGMTRAKNKLYMTSVRRRYSDIEKTPSQFIWEIQPDLIKTVYADQIKKAWDKERQKRLKQKAGATVDSK